MEYPRFVFISPGPHKCGGGTYDHVLVQNAKDHKDAIDAGFSDSVPDALEAAKIAKELIDIEDKPRRGRKPKEAAE